MTKPLMLAAGCAVLIALSPTGARAQDATPTAPAALFRSSVLDTFIVVVPMRAEEAIRGDLEAAKARVKTASDDVERATSLRDRTRIKQQIKRTEIETLKSRMKLERQAKNTGEIKALEGLQKREKLELDLLDQRASLRGAEIDLAKASQAAARQQQKACEEEIELLKSRHRRTETVDGEKVAEAEGRIRDLERRTLDARADLAEKRRDEATREVKLAQSQRKLFALQLKLLAAR